jgi:hypothetical protein
VPAELLLTTIIDRVSIAVLPGNFIAVFIVVKQNNSP